MFKKDDQSKEIITNLNAEGRTVDMLGRLVNATGYLIDEAGNIVKYVDGGQRKIMFHFWEIMYQEPPKLFEFTEFDIRWIQGNLNHDVTQNPRHDDEFDLDGRLINTMGYLIDTQGNIVDQHDKLVFRKEILTNAYGQDARIPAVFTKKGLLKGIRNEEPAESDPDRNRIVHGGKPGVAAAKPGNTTNNTSGPGVNDTTNANSNVQDMSKQGLGIGAMNSSAVFSDHSGLARNQSTHSVISNKN